MKKKTKYFKVICLLFVCILACMITGCANHSTEEKPPAESGNSVESENEISADIETVEADWSEYFNGRNGTAVIYDPSNRRYTVYNQKLAETRSSPCSTFKIISSLIALENGIILPEDSTRTWSGICFDMIVFILNKSVKPILRTSIELSECYNVNLSICLKWYQCT